MAMKILGQFEVFKSQKKGQQTWYWRLRSRNGRIICQSEGYKTRAKAVRTVIKIKNIAFLCPMLICNNGADS